MSRPFPVLTCRQMGELDRRTAAGTAGVAATSGVELMERAGGAVALAIRQRCTPRPTAILCGPGNNGGDGFVIARHLQEAGWPVQVIALGDPAALMGDAAVQAAAWRGPVEAAGKGLSETTALVVDALFGAGLSRPIEGAAAELLSAAGRLKAPLVAVDVPSGVDGDTGADRGALPAMLTVTFGHKKPGHLLFPGRGLCGEIVVADIGLGDPALLGEGVPQLWENDPALWGHLLPRVQAAGHKYGRGHALILGGWPVTGAARLGARAASRIGAGLVTVAVPTPGLAVYAAALESQIVRALEPEDAVAPLLADKRFNAVLIGPGAGQGGDLPARVAEVLGRQRATVLDADALTAFEKEPGRLFAAIAAPTVLTPHEGEFKRLFPDLAEGQGDEGRGDEGRGDEGRGDKIARARAAAARSGAVIIYKGADTVIAAPDGRATINANAPPTLATAGAGDTLSGLVLGLLAQNMEAFEAAAAGVWIHGAAAEGFGPGLIASDLADRVPPVLRGLGL